MRPDDAPDLVIGWDLARPGRDYTVTRVRCGLTFTPEELEASAQAGRDLLAVKEAQMRGHTDALRGGWHSSSALLYGKKL